MTAKQENMSQEDNTNDVPGKEVQKINAIRDIIFGSDMQEYDQKFEGLKKELRSSNDSHHKSIQELNKLIEEKLSALENQLEKTKNLIEGRISNLEESLTKELGQIHENKMDREKLGLLLEEIGKEIRSKT